MKRIGEFEPLVLITDWSAPRPIVGNSLGLRTIRWRVRTHDPGTLAWKRASYALWEFGFRRRFRDFCRKFDVRAINLHYVGQMAFTFNRLVRCIDPELPLILSFHGADLTALSTHSPGEVTRWRHLLRDVAAVVACSADLGRRLRESLGDSVPVTVIHNGLDVERFLALAPREVAPSKRRILSVGRFEKKKGQDVLLEAFSLLANEYPDVELEIVGATDEWLPALRIGISQYGLTNRVHLHADVPHDQIAEFFRRATVFALPSRQEPFGIVILEAGAFALPVVASRVGGVPEILSNGETGILVAPEDSVGLAKALRFLLDSPPKAKELGDALHEHVLKAFTWRAAYKKYTALL